MNILLINKFLYPKGGSETYILKLGRILESHGHRVEYFGLANEKNTVGNRAGAYVTDMDFSKGIRANLTAPLRIVYSSEARRKLRRVLEDLQPDVVHLNNIQYHLTPSMLLELEAYRRRTGRRVKIVYTAHDYQLICPSHGLFDAQLRICEKCLGGNYLHCLGTKCLKNSRAKSLLATLDGFFWKWSKAYSYIDTIICCSAFMKSKLDTQQRFRDKTVAIHNFSDFVPAEAPVLGDYVLEFGHLSRDKGTYTLLEAARRMPGTRFVFAGYGEAEPDIRKLENAAYVGFQTGQALRELIAGAAVSVYPSEWYENCPFSVIESQALGTPVIGSRMGGIPELLEEGKTGELFTAGDHRELEQKLRLLLAPQRLAEYSRNCLGKPFETGQTYYEKLMRIYE